MIEDHEPPEMTEVAIAVTTMPVVVFQELWAGLGELLDRYGDPNGQIRQAQDWLNITMQGREFEVLCDMMAANAPEPEPDYDIPEPPEDWDDEGDWD